MKPSMTRFAMNFEVYNSIVQFITIDMVNHFLSIKIATKRPLNNNSMFESIVIWGNSNSSIALCIDIASPLPVRIISSLYFRIDTTFIPRCLTLMTRYNPIKPVLATGSFGEVIPFTKTTYCRYMAAKMSSNTFNRVIFLIVEYIERFQIYFTLHTYQCNTTEIYT